MINTEVKLIPTDELIEELRLRHPGGCVIAMFVPEHVKKDVKYDHRIHCTGDRCLELANFIMWDQQDQYDKENHSEYPFEKENDDDDEQGRIDGCGD